MLMEIFRTLFSNRSYIGMFACGHEFRCTFTRTGSSRTENFCKLSEVVLKAEKEVCEFPLFATQRMSSYIKHLQELTGSDNSILELVKDHVYNSLDNLHTRGVIVLLLSKAAGHTFPNYQDASRHSDISRRQCSLAEITEMVHTCHMIHKNLLNVKTEQNTLVDQKITNIIPVLSADFIMANAMVQLAQLRNNKVANLMARASASFCQSQFFGAYDSCGKSVPGKNFSLTMWEHQEAGDLMAYSCQAAMELAGHNAALQSHAYDFGINIGLALQAHADLQPFVDQSYLPPGKPFSLNSIPVVLGLQENAFLQHYIGSTGHESVDNLDFKKIHAVISGGDAILKTRKLLTVYTTRAADNLKYFKTSDASKALGNLMDALHH